jgi:IS5 family transposase
MLGKRSPQGGLFQADTLYMQHVGEDSFHGILGRMGASWFRDEDFEGLYGDTRGRPSVPPSQLCIALLLQIYDGVSDEEAIDRTAYDLRWKVALGLEIAEKLCAKSTLQLFRTKLVLNEAYQQVFNKSIAVCREAGLLKRSKLHAAIDTTPILGRGAVKDTFNLVSDQIRRCVEEACALKGWASERVVAEHGLGRHFASSFKGSVELDWSDADEKRALVGQLVGDARVTLALCREALRGHAAQAERTQPLRAAQGLLSDLLAQDIDESDEDGGGPKISKGTARDRIISTTDPEMRHGHKSHSKGFNGYKAGIVADAEDGVILATDARPANMHDGEQAKELLESAVENSGQELDRILGDTAYGGLDTREELASLDAEIIVKAPPGTRRGMFSLDDFEIDEQSGIATCPAGKTSHARRAVNVGGDDPGWRYQFSREDCTGCKLRAKCTRAENNSKVVQITAKTEALQPLRREQRTPEFRAKYRERVKVEHRIGRCIQLGARQARCFGKAKLAFQIAMVATVANLTLAVSAVSPGGIEGPLLILSALILLVAPDQVIVPPTNLCDKTESQWIAIPSVVPVALKIAFCRPLF